MTSQPIDIAWDDVATRMSFQIVSGDPDVGGNCTRARLTTGNRSAPALRRPMAYYVHTLAARMGRTCYYVEANDGVVGAPESNDVLVTYDTTPPTGSVDIAGQRRGAREFSPGDGDRLGE